MEINIYSECRVEIAKWKGRPTCELYATEEEIRFGWYPDFVLRIAIYNDAIRKWNGSSSFTVRIGNEI